MNGWLIIIGIVIVAWVLMYLAKRKVNDKIRKSQFDEMKKYYKEMRGKNDEEN